MVRRHSFRYQRTIARPVEVHGTGFLTGALVRLRFRPAAPCTGVVFVRTDLPQRCTLPASIEQVTSTQRRTVIGRGAAQIGLVEHVLGALAGLRIDNCVIELNGPEPPGLDGSSRRFVAMLHEAGAVLQPARRAAWTTDSALRVEQKGASLALHPSDSDELRISYTLDYGLQSPIGRQSHTQIVTPDRFAADIANCRTFILEEEADELRRQGIGTRTTMTDLLVFGPRGPIDNVLRFANEPARHKILDLIGDLSLLGCDLRGHVVAYRSGHALNVDLVRAVARQVDAACPARRAA